MAFADPQSITIAGTASTLPRTGSGLGQGTFGSNDGAIVLDVRHQYGRRNRRTAGITSKKFASDPLVPTQQTPVSASIRLVVDAPVLGYTAADLEALLVGFIGTLTAGSNANIKKLLGGES